MKGNSKKGSKAPRRQRGKGERQVVKEAPRQSEERFAKAFYSSPNPISISTLKEGRYVDVNDSFLRTTGYQREEIVGRTAVELGLWVRPEERDRLIRMVQEKGRVSNLELDFRMKSGQIRTGLVSPESIDLGGEPCLLTTISDITERKRAEDALRESEAKYAAVAEQAADGIVVVQDGLIKFANNGHAQITGYSLEELVGMPFLNTLDSSNRNLADQRYAMRIAGRPPSVAFETRILCKDGTVKEAEARSTTIQYQGRPAVLSIVRDVSERKQAEEALQESEAWFRGIYEDSPIAIELFDPDGHLIGVNKAGLNMFGQRDDTKLKWFKLLEDPYLPEDVKQKVRAGQVARYERRWDFEEVKRLKLYETTRSGVAHLDVMVSPLGVSEGEPLRGYVVRIQDITERRRAEEALRESEEKYRLLAENATDMIYAMDTNMKVTYVSPSITRLLGFSVEEGMARGLTESLTPASLEVASKAWQNVLRVGKERPGGFRDRGVAELEMYRKDGSTVWVESLVTVMQDSGGRPVGILGVTRDISEWKRAGEELRDAYERETKLRSELEEEMKRRVEFTRAMVHELKTPLTSVIASSELLALELPEGPLLRMVSNISRSADNLNKRIDELFDVARGELGILRLSLTSVDPLRVLRELADDMGPVALRQHQSLVLGLPPALLPVWADEKRLRQVVLNLLGNACKFTDEGGRITLKAREKGDRLIVEVKDTGPGLSEAEQQRLFTAYYRGEGDRERFSGLGLGLALCKTLVELHKGQIWVRSQPGKGSTFGFSVPLATASQRGEGAEGEEEE